MSTHKLSSRILKVMIVTVLLPAERKEMPALNIYQSATVAKETSVWSLSSPPTLRLQLEGCHLIPLYYLLSCFFCLLLLPFLSYLFPACWPILLHFFPRKFFSIFRQEIGFFCMAPVQQPGEVSWSVVCAACCPMALVFAVMH